MFPMIWNRIFDGQIPCEAHYWVTWTYPADSDISVCVYLYWKSMRSRCAGINSLERCRAADGAMTQTINPLLHARTSAEIQQDRASHRHWNERAPAFRQPAEEPDTFPLILHGHQNTLRIHDYTLFLGVTWSK